MSVCVSTSVMTIRKPTVVQDYEVARFKNSLHNKANFLSANYPCKDCNNDHSENPTNWVTPADMRKAFLTLTIHYKTT